MAIKLISTVQPMNETYPIAFANDIKGGVHFAETVADRDAINPSRLQLGMLCYVQNIDLTYQYKGEVNGWVEFRTGSAGTGSGNGDSYHYLCDNIAEMDVVTNVALGSICYVASEKLMYYYSADGWTKFGTGSGGGGGGDWYIGDEPPTIARARTFGMTRASETVYSKNVVWIDTTTPYSLSPTKHIDRLKLNYLKMITRSRKKLENIEGKLSIIDEKINLLEDKSTFTADFAKYSGDIDALYIKLENAMELVNNGEEISDFKTAAQQTKKEVKSFIFDIIDFYNDVLFKIDEELGLSLENSGDNIDKPEDGGDDTPGGSTSVLSLLTEDGEYILTEDGLQILIEGYASSSGYSESTLLNEFGQPILTEDGLLILLDGYSDAINNGTPKDAILTELGFTLLTEDSRIILKD